MNLTEPKRKKQPKTNTIFPPRPREKVLIVLHDDGWVEAYAEKNVDVYIVQHSYH